MNPTGRIGKDQGFTLIELLVVIALVSIAMVMFSVWLPSLEDRLAVDRSAKKIERELTRAAHNARMSGSDQVVRVEAVKQPPRLTIGRRVIYLDPSVLMTWFGAREAGANSEVGAVAFLATGGSSGGAVELQKGQARTRVDIDWLTGSVRQEAATDDAH